MRIGTAAFLFVLVLPRVAHAAEPSDKDGDTVVVTGTRTPTLSQRATVRTDVVTREEAERRGATNVAEALASQPGVLVTPEVGGVSSVQIQGFDKERVLVLEDGERIVGDIGGVIDLAAIPIGDVDRIEIVSGPTSALYGSSALGGVVNIITAAPREEGPSGRGRLEYRSRNGVLAQGSGSYRKGDPWIGFDANYFRMDGIARDANLPDLRVPETSRAMFGVRGGARISPEMDFRIRARAFRDRQDGLETQQPPGLKRFTIDTPAETDRYTLHLVHVTKFAKGSSLRLTLGRQWFDNFTARDIRDSPIDERHDRKDRMQSFEGVGTIADGARTWVFGARAESEHFEQNLTRTSSTSTGPITTNSAEVLSQTFGSAALYGQVGWKLGDLTVMPGARFETHTRYGNSLAPRLAAAYRVSRVVTVRAGVGRGFRAPSPKELGFVFDHTVYGYTVIGSPDLRAEKSWGVNGDIAITPNRTTTLRAIAYMNWVEDLIDLDLAAGGSQNGIQSYAYKNFGKARTAGAELGAVFKPAPFLRAEASYAYAWTRDDVNEQPLAGHPPHVMTTGLRLEPGWKIEAYVRARVVTSAFLDENTRSPGYQTIDVRLGRELWPSSQAYVGAMNLLDVTQDPNRLGDTRSPLGRVLYIGIKADFPWEEP